MIISRTPLRISFVGGGSDLPSHYREHGGSVFSVAVNRYVYVSVNKSFSEAVRVAYSKVEECDKFCLVEHPLVRNTAKLVGISTGVEITSTADIPAKGTGLGSSSSYTVGLLNALNHYNGDPKAKVDLAQDACKIEIEMCGEPIGKQDQYAAAFGGFNTFKFMKNDQVIRVREEVPQVSEKMLISSLMIFYTGQTRKASTVLAQQSKNNQIGKNSFILEKMVNLVPEFSRNLRNFDIQNCGEILAENWNLKKLLSADISNNQIDEIYNEAIAGGALGGKLLGAGAGGFMMFIAPPNRHLEIAERLSKLKQHFWNVDHFGSKITYQS